MLTQPPTTDGVSVADRRQVLGDGRVHPACPAANDAPDLFGVRLTFIAKQGASRGSRCSQDRNDPPVQAGGIRLETIHPGKPGAFGWKRSARASRGHSVENDPPGQAGGIRLETIRPGKPGAFGWKRSTRGKRCLSPFSPSAWHAKCRRRIVPADASDQASHGGWPHRDGTTGDA